MKRYRDLSVDELAALDDEGIEALIDLECAVKGIPLLPPAPTPVPGPMKATTPVYTVPDLEFLSAEDAQKVLAYVATLGSLVDTTYRYETGNSFYVVKPVAPEPVMGNRVAFTNDEYEAQKETLTAQGRAQAAYDEASKERNAVAALRKETQDMVHEAVSDAFRTVQKRVRYQEAEARYLELANGDADVARRFFENAYPDAPQVLGWETTEV